MHIYGSSVLYKRLWYLTRIVCFSQNALILDRKSIFENPVYIGLDLACRNKYRDGVFGIDWAWFGFGGGGFLL
jgi:hypothetical protein